MKYDLGYNTLLIRSLLQNIKSKATRRAQAEATKHPWDLTHLHLSCLLGNYWLQFANKWPGLAWPPGHDSTIVSKYDHSHNVTNTISIMSMNSSQSYICRLTIMIQDLLNIISRYNENTLIWRHDASCSRDVQCHEKHSHLVSGGLMDQDPPSPHASKLEETENLGDFPLHINSSDKEIMEKGKAWFLDI